MKKIIGLFLIALMLCTCFANTYVEADELTKNDYPNEETTSKEPAHEESTPSNPVGEEGEVIEEEDSSIISEASNTVDEISAGGYYISERGMTWVSQMDYIDVGIAYETNDPGAQFQWKSYNVNTGQWKEISTWRNGNWASWKAEIGDYWLHCEMRTSDGSASISKTIAFRYYGGLTKINGTYAGWQGKEVLLGATSNNPQARIQFKIYNVDKKTWIYLTDNKNTSNWVTWTPERGTYWTHFEAYSEDGRLLDTKTYSFSVGNSVASIHYYSQHGQPWGSYYYGNWTMSSTGCVPTSIAMVLTSYLGRIISPSEIANYLWQYTTEFNKLAAGASGLAIKYAMNNYGLNATGLSSYESVYNSLQKGNTVIALVGPGNFIGYGSTHAIVLHGFSGGASYVSDPNSINKNGWYSIANIWNQQSSDPYDWRGGYVFYEISY